MIQKATLPAITGRITAMAPMAPRVLGTRLRHVPQKRLLVPWQLRSTSQAVNVNANLRQNCVKLPWLEMVYSGHEDGDFGIFGGWFMGLPKLPKPVLTKWFNFFSVPVWVWIYFIYFAWLCIFPLKTISCMIPSPCRPWTAMVGSRCRSIASGCRGKMFETSGLRSRANYNRKYSRWHRKHIYIYTYIYIYIHIYIYMCK